MFGPKIFVLYFSIALSKAFENETIFECNEDLSTDEYCITKDYDKRSLPSPDRPFNVNATVYIMVRYCSIGLA